MGLVGVARIGCDDRQVSSGRGPSSVIRPTRDGVDPGDELPEAQDPLQRLRAIAHRRMTAAAQLPHAELDFGGHVLGARTRVPQQCRRPGHGGVRGPILDQGSRRVQGVRQGSIRLQRAGQPPRVGREQFGEVHALITQFAQRDAEGGSARRRPEADADDDRARRHRGGRRAGVGSRYEGAPARLPDQVGTRVREHEALPVTAVGADPGPQARDGRTQCRGGPPFEVAGRQAPQATGGRPRRRAYGARRQECWCIHLARMP
jgi:hypothetical protein